MGVIIALFVVAWVLAVVAGRAVWRHGKLWAVWQRVFGSSFVVALLAAPGLWVGHGVAPVPALLALVLMVEQPSMVLYTTIIPIAVTWLLTLPFFCIFAAMDTPPSA